MEERVLAVHKLTGLITWVLPIEIENHEALELATEKQIKEAQRKREIEVFGAPIKDGVIPEGPVGPPLEDAPATETNTSKDGAANG